jgi:menaquinone-specific isochorismate synthase
VVAPTSVRTLPVDDPALLLALLPLDGPLAWVRGGEGLVGWGEAARAEFTGPDRFTAAERWWRAFRAGLDIDDPLGVPGSGAVAFASFGFDPDSGTSVVVVPRTVVGRRDGVAWVTVVGEPAAGGPLALVPAPAAPQGVRFTTGSRSEEQWLGAVRQAVARIARGDLEKVVLARDLVATADAPVDARHLLLRLAARYPSCWTFAVDGLVGATPELLVRRRGDQVTSRVLAGTVRRLGDDVADGELAIALMDSDKDLEEHELAVHSVAAALAEHCADLDVPEHPRVLRLANVQHLATDVTGRLTSGAGVLRLAAALHPTAAVCGTPTADALGLIRELEGMDRDRYAGPVGWLGADDDGEFGIALRCARIDGSQVRMFAGCGIVAGSDAQDELAEAQAKFVPIREALEPDPG